MLLALIALLIGTGLFVWSGIYHVGADTPHTRPVHRLLDEMRQNSIAARADDLVVPELSDPARIAQGSGNYDAMCMGCHLAPGMSATELSRGLYPAPPDLTRTTVDAARAFWVVKHGIKASGMPAWGQSMQDEYIWNMVAFVQQLPDMDGPGYEALVASSGGHDHGGGETVEHAHDAPSTGDGGPSREPSAKPEMIEHRHADGTVESHPAASPSPPDGHHGQQHEH
ncbi:MAG: cytochrome c [Pseudomonadota bacterium]|nr:cytochrome c [Pseudomonadota bacterium]